MEYYQKSERDDEGDDQSQVTFIKYYIIFVASDSGFDQFVDGPAETRVIASRTRNLGE